MNLKLQHQYLAWGLLATLLVLHWLWCQFVAYPIAFEKNLKKGKPWVYIPVRWKGGYKLLIRFVTRLILLALIGIGILLANLYFGETHIAWYSAFGIALGFLALRLNSVWLQSRYRQQEDLYYRLHDELRAKHVLEGKDVGESTFKSLAAYQHQTGLRKADEQGQLIKTLRAEAKISRKYHKEAHLREPVERRQDASRFV